jgi:hypothetical protein
MADLYKFGLGKGNNPNHGRRKISVTFRDKEKIRIKGTESNFNRKDIRKLHYLLTYLLTPWSRVLLEKLTGLQLVKKFPAFYGTRRFTTALTSTRHLFLS